MCQPGCRINNTAYKNGQVNPQNPCQVCQSTTSTTQWTNVSNGASCSDSNRCTQNDRCQAGYCAGSPVTCNASDECHTAGTCNPATGYCSNPTKPDGTACNDYNSCTETDTCHYGSCRGTAVVCLPLDQCHDAGVCDRTTGCSNPPKPEGTHCDDADLCTTSDRCQAGSCAGDAVVCPADECNDPCHLAGTCDPTTGSCVKPDAPDGKPCTDGDICTIDACIHGVCTPLTPNIFYDSCSDGVQNCGEEGVDCGGPCLATCGGADPECAGETCSTFTNCNPTGSCGGDGVCATTSSGGGQCVAGSTSCGALTGCPNGISDCAAGDVCAVNTCCGSPVCVPPSNFCGETFAIPGPKAPVAPGTPTLSGR